MAMVGRRGVSCAVSPVMSAEGTSKQLRSPALPRRQMLTSLTPLLLPSLGLILNPAASFADAAKESKEQLVGQVKLASQQMKELAEAAQVVESNWESNKVEAQKGYNSLQGSLRVSALGGIRSSCFHLYRDHVVDPAKFKNAEVKYKEIVKDLEKLNNLLLKASRDELKKEEREKIGDQCTKVEVSLNEFATITA
ncbi:hypothetical protein GUITHDRAFT_154285 [Guillardia theta CCMP2712]|uniref:Uncharacterized protein n=1 Tax=Guillardia theta (strain CCMP2712) TaxID=905079 RepID=L1IVD3_GUITC|nr:hypothetical protein GUITHDRAFT_154285 [Guillardia theta CCMP2712]EKX39775.1 hypothetical protein GUITHDRAFT_154285 [Guillardia theta CCMP2712]|eukprot:XP_005826755.1 hypothetical protein GUITHDRAFT_154285 [Guillardia theta CCMP2712]